MRLNTVSGHSTSIIGIIDVWTRTVGIDTPYSTLDDMILVLDTINNICIRNFRDLLIDDIESSGIEHNPCWQIKRLQERLTAYERSDEHELMCMLFELYIELLEDNVMPYHGFIDIMDDEGFYVVRYINDFN